MNWPITNGIPKEFKSLVTYHLCSDGIYMTRLIPGGHITEKVNGVEGFPSGSEEINFLKEKIPFVFFKVVIDFFKAVEKKFDKPAESYICICYNPSTNKYFLWVPIQAVSGGRVETNIKDFNKECPGCYIAMDIHLH